MGHRFHRTRFWSPVVIALIWAGAAGTSAQTSPPANVNSAQIVDEMVRRNQQRARELKHYQSIRHYEVEYKGLARLDAKLVVEANYDAESGKSFRILSQSGSNVLVNKVLKRLVETEKEAEREKNSTALTPANYRFQLEGADTVAGRPAYAFKVEPLVPSKYVYRGRIWIDAAEFAVVRIEAEPARNPSFWISRTAIHHEYARTEGFWLPAQDRSETKVRLGGKAVLTIDYGTYQIVGKPLSAGGL